MNLKRFLVILILIGLNSFSNGYAEIPLGNDIRPEVEFSENHQYFAVFVPKEFRSYKGYTAVFDAKTKKLLFKIDSLSGFDFKVPNNGKSLYSLVVKYESDKVNWFIEVNTPETTKQYFIFQTELIVSEEFGQLLTVPQWKLLDDEIEMIHKEDGYLISLSNFSVRKRKAKRIQIPDRDYEQEQLDFQEVVGLEWLRGDSTSFKEDLMTVLDYAEVPETELREKYVFIRLIIQTDRTISDLQVFTQFDKLSRESGGQQDEALKERIMNFIKNYSFSQEVVPKGVPYWYYTGKFFLVSK